MNGKGRREAHTTRTSALPPSDFEFRISSFEFPIRFFPNARAGFVKLLTLVPIGKMNLETVP